MDRYSSVVKSICGTTWERLQAEKNTLEKDNKPVGEDLLGEIDGWVGVSCVCSYLKGVKANIIDMSNHLGFPLELIDRPFKRLVVNGMFGVKRDIRNDEELLGKNCSEENSRHAWCMIAGISSGFAGLR